MEILQSLLIILALYFGWKLGKNEDPIVTTLQKLPTFKHAIRTEDDEFALEQKLERKQRVDKIEKQLGEKL
jgi:hypothetical protein